MENMNDTVDPDDDILNTVSITTYDYETNGLLSSSDDNVTPKLTPVIACEGERWFALFLLSLNALLCLLFNGFTIGMIRAHARFHKPHYTVISMCAIVNLGLYIPFIVTITIPHLLFFDHLEEYPELVCRIFSVCGATFLFMSLSSTSILSVIRYLHFCHPIVYMQRVTNKMVYAAFALVFAVSALYTISTELIIGRRSTVFLGSCTLPQTGVNILTQSILFTFIPLAVLMWCTRKIHVLIRTRTSRRAARVHHSGRQRTAIVPNLQEDESQTETVTSQRLSEIKSKQGGKWIHINTNRKYNVGTVECGHATVNARKKDKSLPIKSKNKKGIEIFSAESITSNAKEDQTRWTSGDYTRRSIPDISEQVSSMGPSLTKTMGEQPTMSEQYGESSKGKRRRAVCDRQNRHHQQKTVMRFSQKKAATKTVKLITVLSGTFLIMQFIPYFGHFVMSWLGDYLDGRYVGNLAIKDFVMRYLAVIYGAMYPWLNPLVLIRFDKHYLFFKKYALCRQNRVGV